MKVGLLILLLSTVVSCSGWFKKVNPPLKGVWLETKLVPACQNLVENRVKFKELMCGNWNDINFYVESFFHVQAINFKQLDSKEGDYLFRGKGEIAGGKCFLGISAYVTGNDIQILATEDKQKAQAIIFEMAATHIDTNRDVKGYCSVKYDTKTQQWCAIGVWRKLENAKKETVRNPNCEI